MRLLLSSSNVRLVDLVGKRLAAAGVVCEVRYRPRALGEGVVGVPPYRELWIESGHELQWALSLVAMHCEVGRN